MESKVQTMAKRNSDVLCARPLSYSPRCGRSNLQFAPRCSFPTSLPVAPHSHELKARLIDAQKRQRKRREHAYIAHGRTSTLQDTN